MRTVSREIVVSDDAIVRARLDVDARAYLAPKNVAGNDVSWIGQDKPVAHRIIPRAI